MSCSGDGNRFVCGIRRYEKHRMSVADKPSNNALHNENNKRLEQLMAERSLQDKGVFTQQYRPPFQQAASDIIQNIPIIKSPLEQRHQILHTTSVSSKINNMSKEERVIDFDTYLNVD